MSGYPHPQNNPYQQQGNQIPGNSYQQLGNPYQQQGNPYQQQGNPYGYAAPQQPAVDPTVIAWFQAVDTDRSGKISASELRAALSNGNWTMFSMEVCKLMIGMFDRDLSGTIDIGEFQQLYTYINKWVGIFRTYDRDQSGSIEHQELIQAFQQMGYRLSPDFIHFVISKYNPTSRKLTLDAFIESCVRIQRLTDAFRARDQGMKGVISISYEDFLNVAYSTML